MIMCFIAVPMDVSTSILLVHLSVLLDIAVESKLVINY